MMIKSDHEENFFDDSQDRTKNRLFDKIDLYDKHLH